MRSDQRVLLCVVMFGLAACGDDSQKTNNQSADQGRSDMTLPDMAGDMANPPSDMEDTGNVGDMGDMSDTGPALTCAENNGGCGDPMYFLCTQNAGEPSPTCTDIDECSVDNGACGDVSEYHCTNVEGAAPICTIRCPADTVDVQDDGSVCEVKALQVSTGYWHSCAVLATGAITCWGRDDNGQSSGPTADTGSDFTQVDVSISHTCAVRTNGSISCWGEDNVGSVDDPNSETRSDFVHVETTSLGTCALTTQGSLVCWGFSNPINSSTDYIQLSSGGTVMCALHSNGTISCDSRPGGSSDPEDDRGMDITKISVANQRLCALRSSGTIACWGANTSGSVTGPNSSGATDFIDVQTGGGVTCGLHANGIAECWGANAHQIPSELTGEGFSALSLTFEAACGVLSAGSVSCWGRDLFGMIRGANLHDGIGLETLTVRADRDRICGLRGGKIHCWGNKGTSGPNGDERLFTQIEASERGTCGLLTTGSMVCWGEVTESIDGPNADTSTDYVQIATDYTHTCGVKSNGLVKCWGDDLYGQTSGPNADTSLDIAEVSLGHNHTCVRRTNGAVSCWGFDFFNQVSDVPGSDFNSISLGDDTSCGLLSSGTISCWGEDYLGRVSGPNADNSTDFTHVETNGNTCGVHADGTLTCWGEESTVGPANSDASMEFVDVSVGFTEVCGLRGDGSFICWGERFTDSRSRIAPN